MPRVVHCCNFGESNIVSILINNSLTCPTEGHSFDTQEDCDNIISLVSPNDDFNNGEQILFLTDKTIEAQNQIRPNAQIIFNGAEGSLLRKGFEITVDARFEIYTDGCPK